MQNLTISKIKKAVPLKSAKYVAYVLAGIIQSVLSIIFAIAVKNLINAVEHPEYSAQLFIYVIFLLAVVLLSYLSGVLVSLLGDKLQTEAEYHLRNEVLKSYVFSSYKKISLIKSGDLVSRIEGDVATVASVRVNLIPGVIATSVRLLGTIVALFILQPLFTLIVICCALVMIACSFVVRKIIYKLHKNARSLNSKQASYVAEVNENALAIKAFNAEKLACKNLSTKFLAYKNARLKERYFLSFVNSVINLCFTAFYVGAVIFGVYSIYKGYGNVDFGTITAILQLVLQIKAPVANVSSFFSAYAEMLACAERLFDISEDEVLKQELNDFEKIEVKNLTFGYDNEKVLNNLSFALNKGDKMLVCGNSGEGKSTLVKVLTGLYSDYDGEVNVLYDNKAYAPCKLKGLFAFVPQGNMIFSTSIKENIIFNEEYDAEKLLKVIKAACLEEVINELPNKENTVLADGVSLSEGQEQRLAIARALYSTAPIIVLDEPTSALDAQTEEIIAKNITQFKDKTFIVISHKNAFEKYSNNKITISEGKII